MKLGLGLYKHMLTAENYRFAKQCGCTHIVAHLVDYFAGARPEARNDQPTDAGHGWGYAGDPQKLWSFEDLSSLKKEVNAAGLELEAIENFDPAHWHDVLLGGPKKNQQLENLKQLIRNVGKAGIPIFGYNFSIAGVAGRTRGNYARGNAEAVGMEGEDQTPIPSGMVWNMVYNASAPAGVIPSATHEELWQRLKDFLDAIIPVAEEAGVTLAAHPDDPPTPFMRAQPRLVYQPSLYQKLIDLKPSKSNALEFCVGSLAEMTEGDIYETVDRYSKQGKLAYVHLRNVLGKVPTYKESFIDDGDVDIARVMRILRDNRFNGVIIPDHAPQMACSAPWHAGMAYALGFMQGVLKSFSLSP